MQKIDTWYKAEGNCPDEEYEIASYLLFEAGVATLEELDPVTAGRTEFCFYTGDKAERDRIVAEFPQYNFTVTEELPRFLTYLSIYLFIYFSRDSGCG